MYPSKILLFGEYSILVGSQALAIPFEKFVGDWDFIPKDSDAKYLQAYASNQSLKEFIAHLKVTVKKAEFLIDADRFEADLENGLFFDSTIPIGSGLGSSGALVAAVYDKYANHKIDRTNHVKLKTNLAKLESFFHGQSSGIDPLVSFLNKSIVIKDVNTIEEIAFPINKLLREYNLFLLDSTQKSSTDSFVENFNIKCKNDSSYLSGLKQNYIPLNNACIEALGRSASSGEFFRIMKKLSPLQLFYFSQMIPENILTIMKSGLENDLFYLKLSGSGGGGYFLGFTKDMSKTNHYMIEQGYSILAC